ncbi:CU044_2847 family protein [Kitasatospora cineracea]|uniref:CU044_2847 family protein n=1 Tax=Kitasatospora cineracea TaxID=88074 RepID=UPI003693D497
MQQLIELAMPDGQAVWALVDGPSGPRDTGLGEQLATRLEGLQESLHAVATNVRSAVAAARPDEVAVEFGLELAAGRGGVVAALTGVGGKATFKVTLKWTSSGPSAERPRVEEPAEPEEPGEPAEPEASGDPGEPAEPGASGESRESDGGAESGASGQPDAPAAGS